jgi:hypothetical protein
MKPIFYNQNGTLTAYALACGYVETNGTIRLYKDGCYHVRDGSTIWETFGLLTDARKFYGQLNKRKKMETNYSLIQVMKNARERFKALEVQDAEEDYDNFETTIERLTAGGFVDGLYEGIFGGFEHAIYLLECEGFTEHAHILRSQRQVIENDLRITE